MSDVLELRIDSIAAGGDGVGRHEGIVVFVPRTAPGDRIRVSADRHGRLMRGRLEAILDPSPLRIDPPCPHYVVDRCGGCQLQHLAYPAQLDAKSSIVHDALARIARLDVARPDVTRSDQEWRYRRKLTLKLRRRGATVVAGLHRYDAPEEIFELEDCPITDERVLHAWSCVLARRVLLPHARELRGAVRLLSQGFSLSVEGGSTWPSHRALLDAIPDLAELWWQPSGKTRRRLHSRLATGEAGASFAQVNSGVAAELTGYVLSLVARRSPHHVIDAYAGTGDLAAAIAGTGSRVTAIELDADAARLAATRVTPPSTALAASVEAALPAALPADVLIVNPPRAGLDARIPRILTSAASAPATAPETIIYVSCDPATLARDVARLQGYALTTVRAFDMFPQTAHVETVCELERRS